MFQFSTRWLLSVIGIGAILLATATYSLLNAFLLTCVVTGAYAGVATRFSSRDEHKICILASVFASTAVGGVLLAVGVTYFKMTDPGQLPISFGGDDWTSFANSFIVGCVLGAAMSIFSVIVYAAACGIHDLENDSSL